MTWLLLYREPLRLGALRVKTSAADETGFAPSLVNKRGRACLTHLPTSVSAPRAFPACEASSSCAQVQCVSGRIFNSGLLGDQSTHASTESTCFHVVANCWRTLPLSP